MLAILAAGIYVGYEWGCAAWNRAALKEEVSHITRRWVNRGDVSHQIIRDAILREAGEIGIPLYEEDVRVEIKKKVITVDITWESPLDFPGGYTYFMPFEIHKTQHPY